MPHLADSTPRASSRIGPARYVWGKAGRAVAVYSFAASCGCVRVRVWTPPRGIRRLRSWHNQYGAGPSRPTTSARRSYSDSAMAIHDDNNSSHGHHQTDSGTQAQVLASPMPIRTGQVVGSEPSERVVTVLDPDAGFGKRPPNKPLSRRAKWAIVVALTASHPVLLYALYPVAGEATNTLVLVGPVVATLLFSIRVGVPFILINTMVSGFVFWRLTDMQIDPGLPKALVSVLVTTTVCWGADRLRHFIEQRKAMEAALRQAQKIEAVGRLAAGVAHDINNTLSVIMGSAFALRHELAVYGRPFQDLDNIALACDRGSQLTRNLLGFARNGCSRNETFSLNAVVREVQMLLTRTVPKDLHFELRLVEPPPLMVGEQAQLEHALMNLCLNALDAMNDRGRLTIATRSANGKVSVRVSDTGTGMADHVLEHAFEPFFTTKPVGKGTGMGLAMVYGTVQSLRGTITLASELGVGTTVTLTFPQASANVPVAGVSLATTSDPRLLEGRTVLLVDDEPLVLRAGERMLSVLGGKVLSANTGREGIDVFEVQRDAISLAIIDLAMPDTDGLATMREILALAPQTPILLASGYAPKFGKLESLLEGLPTVAFLAKPYDANSLLTAAATLLPARPATTTSSGKTGTV